MKDHGWWTGDGTPSGWKHFSGTYAHKRNTEVIPTKLPDKRDQGRGTGMERGGPHDRYQGSLAAI